MGLIAAARFTHDPDALRETARDLLARPPYRDRAPGPVTDVLVRIRERLAAWLEAVLGPLAASQTFAWAVVLAATVVVVVLALRWARRLRRDRSATGGVPATPASRSAREWRRESEQHAAAGRWREAVRAAYGALATGLAERGILDQSAGLTVGEIDRQVRAAVGPLAPRVAAAGRVFEDVWYGHRDATADDFDTVIAAADEQAGVR